MRQKFSVRVADVTMNIVCEETQESVNAATEILNNKIQTITAAAGNNCTRTEAALLALLLDRNGEPVSRQEALAAVWSSQASEDTNLVDVYIRYLRQKLDEHFDMRLIRTARGKGYYIKL